MSMLGSSYTAVAEESVSASGKGARFEAEWKTIPAMDGDYKVVQLTTSKALDNKMYLDVDPYVPSLNSVVFMSTRDDDHENLYLMSLDNGRFVQLTDSDDIDGDHANVSPETEEAFFVENRTFTRVSLRAPYEEKKIRTVSDKYDVKGIVALTSDGKTIVSSLYDEDENRSSLVTIDVRSGDLETVKKIDGKVDHVLINPVHGDTLLFHVYGENQIGLVDIGTKKKTLLTDSNDHGVHPFWQANGRDAAFAQREQGDTPEQVVTYNIRKERFFSYDIREYSNHFAMNPAQTIIEGDGGGETPYIFYYYIRPGTNKVDTVKMFKHRSSSASESVHPHAAFINDTDLIFNSDADGNGNVYLLKKK
ncbi:oligogalacturonate lyase family protein [Umezawaea endophytica]|uniref:Oligogalacturonate lyase family protein n=1 Tax=Umezawaea endophytica TaxID=1654476 RepID=A0A9X2VVT9_9PSEU|nr:oligogalacturonate lyase family protein [Umezawaea endophytica]MCS7482934.1 oligogalacturonate lyase family protein [Umezawaea endophytica]